MKKILWVDVETTGLSPTRHGIVSIAAYMAYAEYPHFSEHSFVRTMNPIGREVDDGALKVNGFTRDQIEGFRPWGLVADNFVAWLQDFGLGHGSRAIFAGYRASFDRDMIASWLDECQLGLFSNYIEDELLDVHETVRSSRHHAMVTLPNRKLTTVCEALGVAMDGEAHAAETDILATMAVHKILSGSPVKLA